MTQMRRLATRSLAAVAVVAAAAALLPRPALRAQAAAPDDVRGLWVLSASLTSPGAIAAVVDAARNAGFNTLIVQVRARGEAYYRSAYDPRASALDAAPDTFDPLAAVLEAGHKAGLQVHAWINVNFVASAVTLPHSRDHVAIRHPEWLMLPRELLDATRSLDADSPAYLGTLARWTRERSRTIEGLYLSPIPVAAQVYTADVVRDLVAHYPVDGVHLDYVRYPGPDFDYSAAALAEFRAAMLLRVDVTQRQRLDRQALTQPAAWADALPTDWSAFRRDRLASLVERVRAEAKAARPGLIVSAAVAPDPVAARAQSFQDWADWMRRGLLDVVCPMAYTTDAAEFGRELATARDVAGASRLWAGIGAYRLPAAEAAARVRAAHDLGAAGVVLFSYDGVADTDASRSKYLADVAPALAAFDDGKR